MGRGEGANNFKKILGWFKPLLSSNLVWSKSARKFPFWTSLILVDPYTPCHPGAESKYVLSWRKLLRGPHIPIPSLEYKKILGEDLGHENMVRDK